MSERGSQREKILILCIDSDNDIGIKAGINTPIIGSDVNIEAATKLALEDPEEADANAMFAAAKILNILSAEGTDSEYEMATISGSEAGGLEADRKISRELAEVLKGFPASGVILVSDGYSDESVIPIIQSRVPIISLRHVVVKHSERLEETWAVLLRYGKMLVNDTRYSRFSLGVPGILLVVIGVLWVFNQLQNAGMVTLFVLGGALCIKGFGWDEKIASLVLKLPSPEDQLKIATRVIGVVLIIIGSYLGGTYAASTVPDGAPSPWSDFWYWVGLAPVLIGYFLLRGIDLIIIGVTFSLVGEALYFLIKRDTKLWRDVVGVSISFWLRFIFNESAKVLIDPNKTVTLYSPLVIMTIACLVTTAALVLVIYRTHKRFSYYFEKGTQDEELIPEEVT